MQVIATASGVYKMLDKPANIELILPFGETLRSFTEQSFITKGDLRTCLRDRGVFTYRTDKQDTIPILMSCLLSPREFDFLRECQNTKEDNPKTSTRSIICNKDAKDLIEVIPPDLNINNLISGTFTNYQVVGSPNFVLNGNDPNNVVLNFEIERKDMSKSWATTNSKFKGSINLAKKDDKLTVTMTHTANETKDLNKKLVKHIATHLKDSNFVSKNAEIEKIQFAKFTNEKRIEFFLSLTNKVKSDVLEFIDIVDLEFCPDNNISLPKEIKWMEDKINNLKLNGETLHETFFVKEKDFHKSIQLYSVDSKFNFQTSDAKGQCIISYSFPNFQRTHSPNIELEVNVVKIIFDSECRHINKNNTREVILQNINKAKMVLFELYKSKMA